MRENDRKFSVWLWEQKKKIAYEIRARYRRRVHTATINETMISRFENVRGWGADVRQNCYSQVCVLFGQIEFKEK